MVDTHHRAPPPGSPEDLQNQANMRHFLEAMGVLTVVAATGGLATAGLSVAAGGGAVAGTAEAAMGGILATDAATSGGAALLTTEASATGTAAIVPAADAATGTALTTTGTALTPAITAAETAETGLTVPEWEFIGMGRVAPGQIIDVAEPATGIRTAAAVGLAGLVGGAAAYTGLSSNAAAHPETISEAEVVPPAKTATAKPAGGHHKAGQHSHGSNSHQVANAGHLQTEALNLVSADPHLGQYYADLAESRHPNGKFSPSEMAGYEARVNQTLKDVGVGKMSPEAGAIQIRATVDREFREQHVQPSPLTGEVPPYNPKGGVPDRVIAENLAPPGAAALPAAAYGSRGYQLRTETSAYVPPPPPESGPGECAGAPSPVDKGLCLASVGVEKAVTLPLTAVFYPASKIWKAATGNPSNGQ